MKRCPIIAFLVFVVMSSIVSAQDAAPTGLLTELLGGASVVGITDSTPEFGWIVTSSRKDEVQVAYRIIVASDAGTLVQGNGDMWDSGRVASGASQNVPYAGKPLASQAPYHWKVKTWCKKGGESGWSKPVKFSTGDLKSEYVTTRYPLRRSPVSPKSVRKKADGHYLVDFGKVAFGYLTVELDSPKGDLEMEVHLGERGDAKGVNRKPGGTVRYYKIMQSVKAGRQTLEIRPPKDRRNTGRKAIQLPKAIGVIAPFRFVELVNCPVDHTELKIQQIAVHYQFDGTASEFRTDDEVLKSIWDLCKYSMKATSFCGVYVDGDRERIPYEADAYINQLSHYAVDREYTLARYSHEYLLAHPTWPTEWKQHSVLMAHADWMYTGNTDSVAHYYDLLKKKTLESRARTDGLLNTKGLRDIVDWPKGERDGYEFKPVNTVVNAFYYKTLLQMADIAQALGKGNDAESYRKKAGTVKSAFNAVFWDPKRKIYVDGEGAKHASLHANMMPLAFGLVPTERKKTVADFVVSRGMACSVYGAQYLLEALYEGGRADVALKRMTSKDVRSWYNMLRVGSTITLEAWDNRFKRNQDWNHAWGAVPGNIIPRYLLGVQPLKPGFEKILIRPQPNSLKRASGRISTVRGPVVVGFEQIPNQVFELTISIPANMTARVGIPRMNDKATTLSVDDEDVEAELRNGYLYIDGIGSGTRLIRSK